MLREPFIERRTGVRKRPIRTYFATKRNLEFDVPSYWTDAAQHRGQAEEVNRQN